MVASSSNDDPSKGNFTYWIDPSGFPQLLLRNGLAVAFRPGPWNAQRSTWTDQKNEWTLYSTAQRDQCDNYAICGVNGICKIDQSPNCECMKGFRPKFQSNWDMAYWSDGCVRSTPLDCQKGDGFVKYSGVKLPDTRSSWFNESMNLKECASLCLSNCSCTAYANSDIRGGGSGCLLWFGDLIDIRDFTQNGQEFYVRMAAADLGIVLLSLVLTLYVLLKKRKKQLKRKAHMEHNSKGGENNEGQEHRELPLFDLDTLLNATNNFSSDNKLGEGGFGPVYKEVLEEMKLKQTQQEWLEHYSEVITGAVGSLKLGFFSPGHGPGNSIHSQVQSIHEEGPNIELLEFENLVMKTGDDSDPENFSWQSFDYPCNSSTRHEIWKKHGDRSGLVPILMEEHSGPY
ncbi:G-type lectin S-receptor-like serine/threonine-protein kinase [Vitis vinifera]|uniref:G-type lectin S-receptor-like serine/threonine-protein kinase n=1 Tax=Vitis vinifera TaxID=29760 RepID=A0A438ID88_VITVI|nr:G-type lectin S-receptor-like serine/threonine-protein kinase [Vitis vinifera]